MSAMSSAPMTNEHSRSQSLAIKQVLTVPEAAQILGISRSLAYALVSRDEIKAVRLGRRIVVPNRVIDELLGRNTDREPMAEATLF